MKRYVVRSVNYDKVRDVTQEKDENMAFLRAAWRRLLKDIPI